MVFKHCVSVTNNCVRVGIVFKKEHGMNAFFPTETVRNNSDVSDTGATVYSAFDILRKDIQSFRSHDHFFLPPAHTQTTIRVERANIAGVEPSVLKCRSRFLRGIVVTAGNVPTFHKDLTVFGNLNFDTSDWTSNGTLASSKRMVECHNGRSFC